MKIKIIRTWLEYNPTCHWAYRGWVEFKRDGWLNPHIKQHVEGVTREETERLLAERVDHLMHDEWSLVWEHY